MIEEQYREKYTVRRYETPADGFCLCGCGGRPTHGGHLVGHWNKTAEGRAYASRVARTRPRGRKRPSSKGTVAKRLAARLAEPDANGCREWIGFRDRHGYARTEDDEGRTWLVHRLAYVLAGNVLPDDWALHHACENPACAEVSHLVPMTKSAHGKLHARLRQKTPEQRMQGECRRGHSRAEYGFIWACGKLDCRACLHEANRRRNERRRAARAEAQAVAA